MAIVPYWVHPGIQQIKHLVGGVFWRIISHLGCTSLMSNKCGKLYWVETTQAGGCRGCLYKGLGVLLNSVGVTSMSPGCTPAGAVMKGV